MSNHEIWKQFLRDNALSPEAKKQFELTEKIREEIERGEIGSYSVIKKWCVTADGKPMYLARFDCGEEVGEMQLVISQQAWENLNSDTIG